MNNIRNLKNTIKCKYHQLFTGKFPMCRLKRFQSGQSLFEVILALAITALMLTAIVTLTSRGVATSTNSKLKTQANRYVHNAMGFIRSEKERLVAIGGWTLFVNTIVPSPPDDVWCMTDLAFNYNGECTADMYVLDQDNTRIFKRTMKATIDQNTIKIEVWVRWKDEKGDHETYSISNISNW
jgi:type II secretory pathway pseudopilin PulG